MTDSAPPSDQAPPPRHRLVDGSLIFLLAFAGVTGAGCYWVKGADVFWQSVEEHWHLLLAVTPVIVGAILLGAFAQVLVPPSVIRKRLGQGTGGRGYLLAMGIGILIPGGPIISMPILMAVLDAGADLAACVAFQTSWSLLALARIIQWELPLMGPEFAIQRYLASLPLPIIAAVIAAWLLRRRAAAAKR